MWKDSLCIGVPSIDEQHKELFERTGELLRKLHEPVRDHREECIEMVAFLKHYAVKHFEDEEAYQREIGYKDYKLHKELHDSFIRTVLKHGKKMAASFYDSKDIKEFAGMLGTWLLYHVADMDQQIVKARVPSQEETFDSSEVKAIISAADVLSKLTGIDKSSIKMVHKQAGFAKESVMVDTEFTGQAEGYVTYIYPIPFVKKLVAQMMGFTPTAIDELSISALFELSNIIGIGICSRFAKNDGIDCQNGMPTMATQLQIPTNPITALDTGIGLVGLDINIARTG